MDEKLIYILIASSINLISIPLIYFAFVSKIKEIVNTAIDTLEEDFSKKIEDIRKETAENKIQIEILKSRLNGFDSWLSEISKEVKAGFRTINEQLQRHFESHMEKK